MAKLKIRDNFGVTPNSVLNCKTLSFKAKWLFWYLNSKPDWRDFSAERMARDGTDGRDSIRAWLQELESHWLLERKRKQNIKWQREMEYILKNTIRKADVPKPDDGKPDVGQAVINSKQDISNKDIVIKKDTKDYTEQSSEPKKISLENKQLAKEKVKDTVALFQKLYREFWLTKGYIETKFKKLKRLDEINYICERIRSWCSTYNLEEIYNTRTINLIHQAIRENWIEKIDEYMEEYSQYWNTLLEVIDTWVDYPITVSLQAE